MRKPKDYSKKLKMQNNVIYYQQMFKCVVTGKLSTLNNNEKEQN